MTTSPPALEALQVAVRSVDAYRTPRHDSPTRPDLAVARSAIDVEPDSIVTRRVRFMKAGFLIGGTGAGLWAYQSMKDGYEALGFPIIGPLAALAGGTVGSAMGWAISLAVYPRRRVSQAVNSDTIIRESR